MTSQNIIIDRAADDIRKDATVEMRGRLTTKNPSMDKYSTDILCYVDNPFPGTFDINQPWTAVCRIYIDGVKPPPVGLQAYPLVAWSFTPGDTDSAISYLSVDQRSLMLSGTLSYPKKNVNDVVCTTLQKLQVQTWYKVILLKDGSNLTLYLDGDKQTTYALPSAKLADPNKLFFSVGRSQDDSGNACDQFNGKIDNVYVFGKALAEKEIKNFDFDV